MKTEQEIIAIIDKRIQFYHKPNKSSLYSAIINELERIKKEIQS